MRNNTSILRKFLLCAACVVLHVSCAARISGSLDRESAGDFSAAITVQPRVAALIRSLKALAEDTSPLVIDGALISESFARAPGVASAAFINTSPQAIEGPVRISRIGDFLAPGATGGFIRFQQDGASGGKCSISLMRELGPELLARVSPEVTAYLEALMAPIATGEELSTPEYLELVKSIYGEGISGEISAAIIRAAVDFPGSVESVQGGTFSGRRVEFNIPLVDLLVLEKPLSYEVVWK